MTSTQTNIPSQAPGGAPSVDTGSVDQSPAYGLIAEFKTPGEVLKAARGPLKDAGVCGRLGDLGTVDGAFDVAASSAADM